MATAYEISDEDKFCEIYQNKELGGWVAIRSHASPKFCIYANTLQSLGLRLKEVQDSYIKLTKKSIMEGK